MTSELYVAERKVRRRKGKETRQRHGDGGPARHEFSIKFNTRRKRMLGRCCFRALERDKARDKERNKVGGEGREQGTEGQRGLQRRLILFLGLPRRSIISSGVLAYMKY